MRVLHGSARGPVSNDSQENRRRSQRVAPDQTQWGEAARLRGGVDVRVIDIGERGVLIETTARLHIGVRVEVALFGADSSYRLDLPGTVRRCHVARLEPMTYRGALEFDSEIALQDLGPFVMQEVLSA